MTQLTSLHLDSKRFGAAGAASLAPSLALMAQLTSLHLVVNALGDAGAASLAPSLAMMAQLTSLDLGCNAIGAAGAASRAGPEPLTDDAAEVAKPPAQFYRPSGSLAVRRWHKASQLCRS
jgi:hypothetical protein